MSVNLDTALILYAELSPAEIRAVQRRLSSGELRRIAPGMVTAQPETDWPALIAQERARVLGALFPGSVVSFRSALVNGEPVDGVIYLTSTYTRRVLLPGLTIQLVKGAAPTAQDTPWGGDKLFMASLPRALMENLTITRGAVQKSAGESAVLERLRHLRATRSDNGFAGLRLEVFRVGSIPGLEREYNLLHKLFRDVEEAEAPTMPARKPEKNISQNAGSQVVAYLVQRHKQNPTLEWTDTDKSAIATVPLIRANHADTLPERIEVFRIGYPGHPYPWGFAVTYEGVRHSYGGVPNQCETAQEAWARAAERLGWLQSGTYDEHYSTRAL